MQIIFFLKIPYFYLSLLKKFDKLGNDRKINSDGQMRLKFPPKPFKDKNGKLH